ncbi:MAG: flagellar assembly protein FliW [Oscillospiraceae bacterium]|nr:flagellar assembly protein FliW [Oscillospiraceae bacterium]
MELMTRDYGVVDIDATSIIRFDEGIIGFEDYRDYVLLDGSDEPSPFRCLQSVQDSSLAFMLMDPFIVRPDYEVEIDDEAATRLHIGSNEDIAIFVIVVVPENIKMMSINLKAPIIVNARVHMGAQYIVDKGDYSVRHYLADEVERTKSLQQCEGQSAAM